MALTHVCVWDPVVGFRRITINEACKLYPYGVSARSGHFVCELCADNVLLTAPGVVERHFRHDPASPNKECEERQTSFDPSYGRSMLGFNSHIMPLRLVMNRSNFSLEVGFFYPPDKTAQCSRVIIYGDYYQQYEYSFERIEKGNITYLSVGSFPSSHYLFEYVDATPSLNKFWPKKISGVDDRGSIFNGKNGHLLQKGGTAYTNHMYYLVQGKRIYLSPRDIEIAELSRIQEDNYHIWYIYRINAFRFSEEAAKFFLKYSVFLSEKPPEYYPVWPPYIQDPYIIYHNASEFYFYLSGKDAELKAFPYSAILSDPEDGRLYRLLSVGREQLVSFGRSGAMGFSYIIKQPLKKRAKNPMIVIADLAGNELNDDICYTIPKDKQITIVSPYDGKVVVKNNSLVKYIYRLSANQLLILDDLKRSTEVLFYIGCDCIRTIRFESRNDIQDGAISDQVLAKQLEGCTGPSIRVTHAVGALLEKHRFGPNTLKWLRKTVKNGFIPRSAIQLLLKKNSSDN